MNRRIIIVDDEESILEDYKMILAPPRGDGSALRERAALEIELFGETTDGKSTTQEYYEVATALQGREGVERVREAKESGNPFALAFIDVRMPPGIDGLQAARMIRDFDLDIEIVIVTAYSDVQRREIVEKVGFPQRLLYLKKPFDPDEIRQLALSLTRKWELERKAESHREYLEQLLGSIRRLKTTDISSVKDVLSAILREVLNFVGARKGILARSHAHQTTVELMSGNFAPHEMSPLLKRVEQIAVDRPSIEDITWYDDILFIPLRHLTGHCFVLAMDMHHPVPQDKQKMLKLLLETSSELLASSRRQEQLLRNEKIATIGQVALGIIHEISSPLTAIHGALDMITAEQAKLCDFFEGYQKLLEATPSPGDLQLHYRNLYETHSLPKTCDRLTLYHRILLKGVERIQSLIKNIRRMSRLRDTFDPHHQDICEALEDTLTLLRGTLKAGIIIHKDWESPLMAWCDCGGLKQVFLNILLNAAQAMGDEGEIWISGKRKDERICLSIRDSGAGMEPEARDRIFEAFYTTKEDGTGLGLSIVKGIIDEHKGTIRVDSQPGTAKGTTFHIEIPIGTLS